jgi:spermidine synthase
VLEDLFVLPNDLVRVDADVNRLNDQTLVRYYDREWSRWQ